FPSLANASRNLSIKTSFNPLGLKFILFNSVRNCLKLKSFGSILSFDSLHVATPLTADLFPIENISPRFVMRFSPIPKYQIPRLKRCCTAIQCKGINFPIYLQRRGLCNQKYAILGIETSCDDTAAAVVTSDGEILSNVVSSQWDAHKQWGGIVPRIA